MVGALIALALLPACERGAYVPRLRADVAPGALAVCDDQWPPPFPDGIDDVRVSGDGVPTWAAAGRTWTVREDGTIGPAELGQALGSAPQVRSPAPA